MATPTVSENPEVQQQYATQVGLTAALLAQLRALWPQIQPMSAPAALLDYREAISAVVEEFASASISLAADYYEASRELAGITTAFRMPLVDTPPTSLIDAGFEWAMRAREERADDEARIQKRIEAAMQKAVADSGRDQIIAAVAGDEKALGFARVPRPGACAWCLSLSIRTTTREGLAADAPKGRGQKNAGNHGGPRHFGVYKSRASAGQTATGDENRFHNNCHCVVEPIFSANYAPPAQVLEADRLYAESTAGAKSGGKLNAFRRALDAERRGERVDTFPLDEHRATHAANDALLANLDAFMKRGA